MSFRFRFLLSHMTLVAVAMSLVVFELYRWLTADALAELAPLGVPAEGIDAVVSAMRQRLFITGVIALLLALGAALVASRIVLRPLREMREAAERIARGEYAFLGTSTTDEFGVLSRSLASLATQLASRVGELTAERDRLSAILAGMVEGVLVTAPDGRILVQNPAAEEILAGTPKRQGILGSALDGWKTVRLPRLHALIERAADTGETQEAEIGRNESGTRMLAVYVRPLSADAGGGVVVVLRDLTQIRKFEAARRDFVANASHELRTPVTAIQGYAETLLRGTTKPETTAQFLEIIHRSARRLGSLLDDLLRLSELEARRTEEAVSDPVPISAVAERVSETLRESREACAMQLKIDVAANAVALGDADDIERVIENLVANAFRYGKRGGLVEIAAIRLTDRVRLTVKDDGPGIDAEHVPRIFERFYRVDRARSRERGGTGLGLSIVKHLVESMGGTVRVDSSRGRGCRFVIDLPAPDAPSAD